MFNFFKRDPAEEKLKIPGQLFAATAASASNACNILNGAGLKGKFNREDIFSETCGYHIMIVIGLIGEGDAYGSAEEKFDNGVRFLLETLPGVLSKMKDPTILNGFKSEGYLPTDLASVEKLLIAEKTFDLAASYSLCMGLDVSEEDVLDYARKYNPKILNLSSHERSRAICAYVIRCLRLSHLEDIPHKEFRATHVTRFVDTICQAAAQMQQEVVKLLPKKQ